MKTLATIAGAVVLFDVLCFMAWALSGQVPQDGFYFGAITAHIVGIIL